MRTFLCTLALTICAAAPVDARGLPQELSRALARAHVPASHVALVIQPLDRSRPTLSYHADVASNPASVMKALTTLAALDSFGPAHTFQTQVLVDGKVENGVLTGNLVLRGGGDPALNLEHFRTLLQAIRLRGIHTITGDVIIDNSFFAIEPGDPGEFDGEPLKPYNAAPTALLVNYNALPLNVAADDGHVAARLEPPSLAIQNTVVQDHSPSCGDWQDGLTVERHGESLSLSGRYPATCGFRTLWLNLMSPTATVATLFRANWAELGGSLSGQIRTGDSPASATPLLEFDSPELSEIVRGTNKYSNNVMAKMLFLDLGAARFGAPATWDKGERAIREWLKEKGLSMPELVVENGSGLSRIARVSPAAMARLLVWASSQPLYYEFAASLPALGLEGTQRRRLKNTPVAGRAWLKSGSLHGIHNLAGYVLDADGKRKVVVLFIYDAPAENAKMVQAAVLHWLIDRKHLLPGYDRPVNTRP